MRTWLRRNSAGCGSAITLTCFQLLASITWMTPSRWFAMAITTVPFQPKLMASNARIFVELHPWAWEPQDAVWAELLEMCRRTRREIRLLDGTPLTEPAHRRTEFARL